MSWVIVAVAGTSAVVGAVSSISAANKQASAAKEASAQQLQEFNTINEQEKPYREAGYGALNSINAQGDYFNKQMTPTDLTNYLSPSYDFMIKQGQGQTENLNNSTGGLISGNTMQGLNKFTQDYALNAGQTAFSNYQTQKQDIFNRLASVAGIGQTGQTQTNTAGQNAVNASTAYQTSAAAAQAAGIVGAGNSINSGLTNMSSWYAVNNMNTQQPSPSTTLV